MHSKVQFSPFHTEACRSRSFMPDQNLSSSAAADASARCALALASSKSILPFALIELTATIITQSAARKPNQTVAASRGYRAWTPRNIAAGLRSRTGWRQASFVLISRREAREGGPIKIDSLLKRPTKPKVNTEAPIAAVENRKRSPDAPSAR